MKAVIYTRVSTLEQASEGVSLENQLEKIKIFCHSNNHEIVKVIIDDGYSGKSLERPGIKKIIDLIKAKEINLVVTYKVDRLARSIKDLSYLIEDIFNKSNISFTSVVDNFDTTTANGKLILNILGSLGQWEGEMISERIKDSLNYKKRNKKIYSPLPFGFSKDLNGNLLYNDKEQHIIKNIKKLRNNGCSLSQIANKLNSRHVPTKKNKKWYKSTIKKILDNNIHDLVDNLQVVY
jgi:site-specific DNA recombinase